MEHVDKKCCLVKYQHLLTKRSIYSRYGNYVSRHQIAISLIGMCYKKNNVTDIRRNEKSGRRRKGVMGIRQRDKAK